MAGFSLRRYDTQARFGLVVSLASVVTLLALGVFVSSADEGFRNLKGWVLYYGTRRRNLVLGCGALTILLAAIGFGFGLNSVGQRRNDKPLLSWLSFFLGGIVLCLALVLLFFFYKQGEPALIP